MLNNPGRAMIIYDILPLIARRYLLAMIPSNIISEFWYKGIHLHTDVDFASNNVSNRNHPPNQLTEDSERHPICLNAGQHLHKSFAED